MSNAKAQGHRLQEELNRWFVSLTTDSERSFGQPVQGLNGLKHHIEVLIREGWTLKMSADNSPADRAGVDFIWSHPQRGWFALDSKAVGQTSCRLIQQVHVANNREAGEYKQLRFEDKLAFLQQLVNLARSGRPIKYDDCAPPSLETKSNAENLEEVCRLQKRLEHRSHKDERFNEWAVALRRAIGFMKKQERGGSSEGAKELARKVIAGAVDSFFAAFFSQNNVVFATHCMRMQPNLRRSEKLAYICGDDTIKAAVGPSQELVVFSGLATHIRQTFDKRYSDLVRQHSTADWLLQRKRTFETKGVECAINSVLDAFQRQVASMPARRKA